MKKYLHDFDGMLNQELSRIEASPIGSENKELIAGFREYNLCNDISTPRILRQIGILRLVAERISKRFDELNVRDLEKYFAWMKQNDFATESINLYKAVLKKFFKWQNKGTYPESVAWIRIGKTKSLKLPEDLLNQDEIKSLLKAATTPRDKALLSVLWESGARIGEIGSLQLKNVSFDEYGCQIMVDGKTGMRRIRLVNSAPALLEWINQHPFNDNPNRWLWINLHRDRGELMGYRHIAKILANIAEKAGVKKKVNPQNFRHSRATYLSQFLTEAQMKEYFGWTQDSSMAARYIHLSGKQVDDAILQLNGLKKSEQKESILQREACPRCKTLNDINHQYCTQCWLPLTPQATISAEIDRQKDQEAMAAVLKLIELTRANPELLRQAILEYAPDKGNSLKTVYSKKYSDIVV